MSDTIKCFRVEGEGFDAEAIEIIFAKSSIEAKRRWSNEHWDGDEIAGISAKRIPEWDQYAKTGVPALVMIDDGWYFECHGCGTTINSDYIGSTERSHDEYDPLDAEYGADQTLPIMEPVELPWQRVYCTQQCCDDDLRTKARRKRAERRALDVMKRSLIAKLPGAEILPSRPEVSQPGYTVTDRHHAYASRENDGTERLVHVSVHFMFPGAKYGGTYRYDRHDPQDGRKRNARLRSYYVANGDREAFDAWRAEAHGWKPAEEAA